MGTAKNHPGKRIPPGGKPVYRARVTELKERITILEKALGMRDNPMNLTSWELLGSQEIRDDMAVRAWWNNLSSPHNALLALGFSKEDACNKEVQARVLFTPGFNAIYEKLNKSTHENWEALIARQNKNALLAKSDGDSTRAFTMLAKIEGKLEPEPVQQIVHLHTMIGLHEQPDMKPVKTIEQQDDPLSILSHEPGEPIRISTGDKLVERILSESEEQ